MKFEAKNTAPAEADADLLVVFAADQNTSKDKGAKPDVALLTSDESVKRAASHVLAGGEFKAKANETLLFHKPHGLKSARLLVVGLGTSSKVTIHGLRNAGGTAVRFAKARGLQSLAVLSPANCDTASSAQVIAEGAVVADFDSDTYRTDRKDASIASLTILASERDQEGMSRRLREGEIVAESQNFARTLINEPSNRMTPTILGQRAAAMAAEFGMNCEVHGAEKLRELKMGAFLGVAQGSDEPPALIVMRYEPADAPAEPVLGLVGKGITFDSGGLS